MWQMPRSAVEGSLRTASKKRQSGASHEGSSRIPCAYGETPSFSRGSSAPGPPVPTTRAKRDAEDGTAPPSLTS